MSRSGWAGVSLPIGLLDRLQRFLESDYAKYNGFNSKADVIIYVLREFLDNYDQMIRDQKSGSPPPN